MRGTLAKSWTTAFDGWPEGLRGWFSRDRDDDTADDGPRLPHGERRLLTLVALGFCLIVGWWWFDRGPEVKVIPVTVGDAAQIVYATGIVEPVNWAKVTALSRKRIVDICKCEGQAVKKGDVVVRLDDDEEQAVLQELQSRLQRLNEEAARFDGLVKRNTGTRVALDDKLTEVRQQEARVAMQKDRISDLALKSPLDGIVMRRTGEIGEIAGIGEADTLLWIGEEKPLKIIAEVNEDDILKVAAGQRVLLRHEGSSAPLPATVERITPKGDPETKTFRVHLSLPDDSPLKVGMSVEANIVVSEAKNVLIVPAEAIVDGRVLKVADGKVIEVLVTEGIRGTDRVEVRGDLQDGDFVITPPVHGLGSGDRVRPIRGEATAGGQAQK